MLEVRFGTQLHGHYVPVPTPPRPHAVACRGANVSSEAEDALAGMCSCVPPHARTIMRIMLAHSNFWFIFAPSWPENDIDDDGAAALASMLEKNTHLETLNLHRK